MYKNAAKRLASLMAAVFMALSCVLSVSAAGQNYYLPEINDMKITLPDGVIAVKRGASANDRYFSLFGIDCGELMRQFEAGDIYLQGMDSAASTIVTVSMTADEATKSIGNYNLLQSRELGEFARAFMQEDTYTACTVGEAGKPITWLYFNAKAESAGRRVNIYQGVTVYDGKNINVTLQRNGTSVTAADYEAFNEMINSVSFGQTDVMATLMPFILLGALVLLAIVIIILIIVIVKRARSRRKKNDNDKILRELAGKYSTGRKTSESRSAYSDDLYYDDSSDDLEATHEFRAAPAKEPEKPYTAETSETVADDDYFGDVYEGGRSYSDADIDALLGDDDHTEGPQDFPQALPDPVEEQEVKDVIIAEDESISEFFDDGEEVPSDQEEEELTDGGEVIASEEARPEDAFEEEAEEKEEEGSEEVSGEEAAEEAEEEPAEEADISAEAPDSEVLIAEEVELVETAADESEPQGEVMPIRKAPEAEDIPEAKITPAPPVPPQPEEEEEEAPSAPAERSSAPEEEEPEPTDEDEYFNDEVLVREEVRKNKFKDSDDFFDEAPKKVMGVISSKEIAEAEEYDVIGEVEKKVSEVERETPSAGEKVLGAFRRFGGGLKNFGVHCGYFATNVRREIKRSRAKKKRQKAEEERRRRARERAERQRAQRDSGGLVQVHSRGQRPPQSGSARNEAQRKGSAAVRKPSSGRPNQGRPNQGRPNQGRPAQKKTTGGRPVPRKPSGKRPPQGRPQSRPSNKRRG